MVSKRTKNSWAAYKPRGSPGPAAAEQRRGEAGGTSCLPLPQPHRRPRGVSVAPPGGYVRVLPRPPAPVPLPRALTRLRLAHRGGTGRGAAAPCPRARPPRPSSCSAGASPRRCGGLAAVGGNRPSSGVRRRSAGRDSLRSLLPPYLTARADLTADGKRGNRQPQPAPCRSRTAGPRRVTLAARQRRFKGPRQRPPLPCRSREPAETQTAILGDGEQGPRQPPVPVAGDTFTAVPPSCPNVILRAASPGAVTPTGFGRGPSCVPTAKGGGDARGTPSKRLSRDKCCSPSGGSSPAIASNRWLRRNHRRGQSVDLIPRNYNLRAKYLATLLGGARGGQGSSRLPGHTCSSSCPRCSRLGTAAGSRGGFEGTRRRRVPSAPKNRCGVEGGPQLGGHAGSRGNAWAAASPAGDQHGHQHPAFPREVAGAACHEKRLPLGSFELTQHERPVQARELPGAAAGYDNILSPLAPRGRRLRGICSGLVRVSPSGRARGSPPAQPGRMRAPTVTAGSCHRALAGIGPGPRAALQPPGAALKDTAAPRGPGRAGPRRPPPPPAERGRAGPGRERRSGAGGAAARRARPGGWRPGRCHVFLLGVAPPGPARPGPARLGPAAAPAAATPPGRDADKRTDGHKRTHIGAGVSAGGGGGAGRPPGSAGRTQPSRTEPNGAERCRTEPSPPEPRRRGRLGAAGEGGGEESAGVGGCPPRPGGPRGPRRVRAAAGPLPGPVRARRAVPSRAEPPPPLRCPARPPPAAPPPPLQHRSAPPAARPPRGPSARRAAPSAVQSGPGTGRDETAAGAASGSGCAGGGVCVCVTGMGQARAVPCRAKPERAEPSVVKGCVPRRAKLGWPGPSRAKPGWVTQCQAEPSQAGSSQRWPRGTVPGQAKACQPTLDQAKPSQTELCHVVLG
ncbi:spidroin-2-like [Haliaeetus albicilla]|uniref:spidroin-2-like n=1 Tax=Haliaeetus albicilla TaxID=8969 RepID=UPI0037E81A96